MFTVVFAIPMMGGVSKVYAGGGYEFVPNLVQGVNSDGTVTVGAVLSVSIDDLEASSSGMRDAYLIDETVTFNWGVQGEGFSGLKETLTPTYTPSTGLFTITVRASDVGKYYTFYANGGDKYDSTCYNNNSAQYLVVSASSGSTPSTPSGGETPAAETSLDIKIDSKGIATITGTTTGSADFKGVYTENYEGNRWIIDDNLSGKSFSVTFDTKKLNIGYHPLYAVMTDDTEVYYPKVFPTAIYDKPSLKASYFETNNKTITFSVPNHNGATYDYYLQMKGAKSDWSDASLIGPLAPNDKVKLGIKNIKAGKKYTFRPVYVKETTYGGNKYYFFSTTVSTPKAVTIKTGPKAKPAVKSVTISKGKQHKVWVKPLYKGIILVHEGYWVWETDYTVTVKFKKKPGIVGLYIHGTGNTPLYTYVKGNKTTYKAKFTWTGKKIGKTSTISIYTKTNKNYGAYSPVLKKKTKIKK